MNIITSRILIYLNLCCLIWAARSTIEISNISKDIVASVGDNVELNCSVRNIADKSVNWVKYTTEYESETPGDSVTLSMRNTLSLSDARYAVSLIKVNENEVIYSLKIRDAEASDMGIYECQVIVTVAEKVTRQVNVAIKHTPQISMSRTPKSRLVTEGQNLEITCRALGFPQPTIYWTREHNEIMPAGGQSYAGPILRVKQVHRLDRGNYYCNADNGVGIPGKSLIRIEVEFRPQILTRRPKVAQMPSHPVELECIVKGYPAPAVFWQRNGQQLVSNRQYVITNIASAHETTTSVLRIASVSSSDYGDYYCNDTNKLGHADARLHLFQPVIPVPY